MPEQTMLEKLQLAPPSSFHLLEPAKAKRMNAKTLYIPSAADVEFHIYFIAGVDRHGGENT